ncbi:1-phosphofructokinase family hexose kinase [Corynebacterium provencense]|uniref:1-phosphofructokinase family hexose kinase n=1 Tax=Corynebacterium provencense TaxID=1737425 RepID=UPI000831FA36|nr:hexose kinase [Corynebacterium provencense]
MIVTVTPNPSIDRTRVLAGPLTVGGVNRVVSGTDQAGGKGVNVATVLHRAGEAVLSVVPAPASGRFAGLVAALGVPTRFTGGADARVNLTVVDTDGTTTKINEPGGTGGDGLPDPATQLQAELGRLGEEAAPGDWLVLAGSLPPGFPGDWYATVTSTAHAHGLQVAVDTSDIPLTELVRVAGTDPAATPDLIKPNSHELAQILGGESSDGDAMEAAAEAGDLTVVADAACRLTGRGFTTVVVSLGAAGAVLAADGHAWYCPSPAVDAVSTVGAGDSTLAGYLLGTVRGLEPSERLALAVAHGSAAVTLPGTTLPSPTDLPTFLPEPRQIR